MSGKKIISFNRRYLVQLENLSYSKGLFRGISRLLLLPFLWQGNGNMVKTHGTFNKISWYLNETQTREMRKLKQLVYELFTQEHEKSS